MILQTHNPEHPLLALLLERGYRAFAQHLLADRRDAGLPPYAHFALLRAEAPHKPLLDDFLAQAMRAAVGAAVVAHGPLDAPMPRRAGAFRGQVLLESPERIALQAFLPGWLDTLRASPEARKLRWSIDVDPVDLY